MGSNGRPRPCSTPLRHAAARASRFGGIAAGPPGSLLVWAVVLGNAAVIVWLWVHGGNLTLRSSGDVLTSIARITGLLSAYLALIQVILLARVPALERLVGFDRLTVWHRWNGHACLDLVLAHVVFSVWGYALLDKYPVPKEISTMLGGGIYPGMITATVGTVLLHRGRRDVDRDREAAAALRVVVRRAPARVRRDRARLVPPDPDRQRARARHDRGRLLARALRRHDRPARRVPRPRAGRRAPCATGCASPRSSRKAPGVVSLRITGRRLERLNARAGQFFLWRFLTRGRWWTAHPFSLSAAPDGRSLRITVKALGDHTAPARGDPGRHARRRRGAVRRLHGGVAPAREGAADRRRHRHHADPRAAAGDARRRRRPLPRRRRRGRRLPAGARRARPRVAAPSSTTSSATTRPRRDADCSRPTTCASSSPTSPSATSTSAGRPR